MQMRSILLAVAILLAAVAPLAAQTVTKVGETKDACSAGNNVTFHTTKGTATVKANSSPPPFDLPGLTREITWYCHGTRERSANDTEFNRVQLSRAKNGAMHWTFFRVTLAAATRVNPQVNLGVSKDACDASQLVTFNAMDGPVKLKAGQMVFKELPTMTRDLVWKCGNSNERVANPNAFDFIQAERAGNGALHWVFYRTMTGPDDSTGNYVDLLLGDVVIQAPALNITASKPGFLKQQLDTFWDQDMPNVHAKILAKFKSDPTLKDVQVSSLTLSPSAQAELRVGDTAADVRLKYVVHQNEMVASKLGVNFRGVFDIEVVIVMPRQQKTPFQASSAPAFAHHFELHGASAGDDFLAAFAKSRIHAIETGANSATQSVLDDVNKALAGVSTQVGVPDGIPVTLSQTSGTIQACVKIKPGDTCNFPAVAAPATSFRPAVGAQATPARKTLDTSHDQCGESKLWIWDYQKGRFIAVPKGGSAVIEVDNQRFEWFCGGATQPDAKNDEWATGPEGTYFVKVKRDPSGRQIDWTFQSWH